MAQPEFLSGGDTPRRTDTDWTAAVRWLGRIQNHLASPDPNNNPRKQDSLQQILTKIARALSS